MKPSRAQLEALDRLLVEVIDHDQSATQQELLGPRKGRKFGLPAVVALAFLSAGGVAAATMYQAHTGVFGAPGFSENDTSEYLDKTAPDFRQVARGYARGVDFAPGYDVDQYLGLLQPGQLPAGFPTGRRELTQVTGVKGDIAGWAFCSWQHTWAEARRRADSKTEATSLRHLSAIADEPVMAPTNRQRTARMLVDAATSGHPQPMESYLQTCPAPKAWAE